MNSKANSSRLAYVGKKPGSRDSNSWYTPKIYTDKARKVMGRIDLDPFSSEIANKNIGATRIFTEENSAFGRNTWKSGKDSLNVWMNPPYSRGIIQESVAEFLKNWHSGEISQAILLLNNATETKWMQSLLAESSAICLVNGRISFVSPDNKTVSGNTRGQIFLYFGTQARMFSRMFSDVGMVATWI